MESMACIPLLPVCNLNKSGIQLRDWEHVRQQWDRFCDVLLTYKLQSIVQAKCTWKSMALLQKDLDVERFE